MQRQGYVDAFRDAELISLISGLERGIAVTLQYWATEPAEPLNWYHITDAASANAFADAIAAFPRPDGNLTNVAAAIDSAANLLLNNDFEGDRLVMDVSGDGGQNINRNTTQLSYCSPTDGADTNLNPACTGLVSAARDAAVAQGITINGLPILTDVPALDDYFLNYVIGGEGAFVQTAATFRDFETAVTEKIKREILPDPVTTSEPSAILGVLVWGLWGSRSLLKRRDRRVRARET